MSIHAGHSPTVSVLMSVYNGEQFLGEAVESILDQTYRDFEFIVVNDGSTDGTGKILEAYHDKRIVLIHQRHAGLTKALNQGLSMARGAYIARMDADDISLPERLEKQIAFLEDSPAVGLISSHFYVIDHEGKQVSLCQPPVANEVLQNALLTENQFCHGAAVFRSDCIKTVGTYRDFFKFAQDFDLWLRIAEKYHCGNLGLPLYKWRGDTRSLSLSSLKQKDNQFVYAAFAILLAQERRASGMDRLQQYPESHWDLKNKLSFNARRTILSPLYFMTSKGLHRRADISSALMLAQKALLCNPFSWRIWKHLVYMTILNYLK
ncbi:MAG: glycosyltransferase [Proteobacteria bacterium]|nr:glycosyltransferase [Pseudomonadota bacterium]